MPANLFNGITLAHKYALLLSPDNCYLNALMQLPKNANKARGWTGDRFQEIYNFKIELARDYARGIPPSPNNAEILITQANKFLDNNKAALKGHPILGLTRLTIKDFALQTEARQNIPSDDYLSIVGEEAVWRVAKKLGLNREQTHVAIDDNRNSVPKRNCGHVLADNIAESCFSLARGVYLLLSPTTHQRKEKVLLSTMRVSHLVKASKHEGKSIRVKVNVPNVHDGDSSSRYQYRGYLIPVNGSNTWSIHLGQAPHTVNLEEAAYRDGKFIIDPFITDSKNIQPNEYRLHIADDMQLHMQEPLPIRTICGMVTSLGQRPLKEEKRHKREPYSAACLFRRVFDGNFSEKERCFMQQCIGVFDNLEGANQHVKMFLQTDNQFAWVDSLCDDFLTLQEKNEALVFKCPVIRT